MDENGLGVDKKYLQLNGTLPGAHTQNQAEVNVLAAVCNVLVAELSNNLEKLLEMEILGACHNIDHVVKLVFFILLKVVSDLAAAIQEFGEFCVDLHEREVRKYHE
jgi:hypothetical protein